MATQLFTQTEEQLDTYLPAYKNIMSAVGFVNLHTGETIKLSAEQKIVWFYILDRYKFFKEKEQLYFDNQADIALACGVSERTVLRFVSSLNIYGYLQINQTRIGGHKSNSYVLLSDLVLVQPQRAKNNAKNNATVKAALPPTETENASNDAVFPIEQYDFDTNLDGGVPAGESFAFEVIPYSDENTLIPELEDDGSVYDALTFVNITDTAESVDAKPMVVALPDKRFNPNGTVSDAMINYCKANGIKIKTTDDTTIFVVDGKECKITVGGFVPYTTAPKSKAVPKYAAPETSPWEFEPF